MLKATFAFQILSGIFSPYVVFQFFDFARCQDEASEVHAHQGRGVDQDRSIKYAGVFRLKVDLTSRAPQVALEFRPLRLRVSASTQAHTVVGGWLQVDPSAFDPLVCHGARSEEHTS